MFSKGLFCCNYTLCANLFREELKWTRQGETIDWGYGFALPRLISRPQEGFGEECGRVSDWGFSENSSPKFVPVKLARRLNYFAVFCSCGGICGIIICWKGIFFTKNTPLLFSYNLIIGERSRRISNTQYNSQTFVRKF